MSSTSTTIKSASAECKSYTDSYRNCLKDCRDSGRSKTSSKTCKPLAIKLDNCREEWRRKYAINNPSLPSPQSNNNNNNNNNAKSTTKTNTSTKSIDNNDAVVGFDGTRILPNPICRPLSCSVQSCIKWHQGDQTKCKKEINSLKECMKNPETKDVIVKPTEGDKIWTV
jgi:hypothetical protein